MPRKLKDIDVDEITLCESAANRKKFFILKSEDTMEEFIKQLKKFMAPDEEEGDEEQALTEKDIEKAEKLSDKAMTAIKGALNILNKYKADMPDDVLKAIQTLAKYASYGYPAKKEDIDKAGAKLSKTTRDQIQKALDYVKESPKAIAVLKTLLGQEVQKTEPTDGDGDEKLSAETLAKLDRLAELEKAEAERKKAEDDKKAQEDLDKKIEKKLEEMGVKSKGVKKSIDGQDEDKDAGDKDTDEEEDKFPSVPIPDFGNKD